ncbi:MAG: AMP-binding protein [Polyangiaceae bacterium]
MTLSIFETARAHADAIALIADDEAWSYAALAERVARLGGSLATRGLLGDAPVGLVARPTLASIELFHALLAYQVPVLLLHPALPPAARSELASRAGVRAVLAPDEERLPLAAPLPPPLAPALDSRPLAIVPTSGSSGAPKLVVLSHGAFAASARASAANLPLGPGDRWLLCLPPSHVGGLSIVTRCLLSGSAVVLFDAREQGLQARLPDLAACSERHAVSVISLVPALLDAWLSALPLWRPSVALRALLVGGAALPPALFDRARGRGFPLLTTYGLTEACSQVTTSRPGESAKLSGGVVSSGLALAGVEVRVDSTSRIFVRSKSLCSGYLGADTPIDAEGWLRTEDRGFLDERGELFVLGRIGELIITGGENVDPQRVEAALRAAPHVLAAAVFGAPDERFGSVVACALVVSPEFDAERVSAHLRQQLSRFELPRRLALVSALPSLANGKLDRSALARLPLTTFAQPRS